MKDLTIDMAKIWLHTGVKNADVDVSNSHFIGNWEAVIDASGDECDDFWQVCDYSADINYLAFSFDMALLDSPGVFSKNSPLLAMVNGIFAKLGINRRFRFCCREPEQRCEACSPEYKIVMESEAPGGGTSETCHTHDVILGFTLDSSTGAWKVMVRR